MSQTEGVSDNSVSDNEARIRERHDFMALPPAVAVRGKSIYLTVNKQKLFTALMPFCIVFRPFTKGRGDGRRRYFRAYVMQRDTYLDDHLVPATASDIASVCGRPWHNGGNGTSGGPDLLRWLGGRCSCCAGQSYPSLIPEGAAGDELRNVLTP